MPLIGAQPQGMFGVFLDGLIAEPPVDFIAVHKRLHLVGSVGIELPAGHPTGQNRQDLVGVGQISHHPEGG